MDHVSNHRVVSWQQWWGYLRSWVTYDLLYPIKKRRMFQLFNKTGLEQMHLVFDIGAHLGDKTRFFAEYGKQVVAVEPQPYFKTKLTKRFSDMTQVTVVPKAVSHNSGTRLLRISSKFPTVSTLQHDFPDTIGQQPGWKRVAWDRELEVEVVTLDQLVKAYGRPDFVKIDVEGHEAEVLSGLSSPITLVSFEYLPAYPSSAINSMELLDNLASYSYAFSSGESFQLSTDWLSSEGMRQWLVDNCDSGDIYAKLKSSF